MVGLRLELWIRRRAPWLGVLLLTWSACSDLEADKYCASGRVRACGSDVGECTIGTQTCKDGEWGACSGQGPAEELCDGHDNDCDSDIDESFGVGEPCSTDAACPGRRACVPGGQVAACVAAPDRFSRERCDGEDNDCDGWPDGYFVGAELVSACACEEQTLAITAFEPDQLPFSETCKVGPGFATIEATVNCSEGSYALCTSEPVNLRDFDVGSGGSSLVEVAFEVTGPSRVPVALNLWYLGTSRSPGRRDPRKYLPLLPVGGAPGSYVRRFAPESACFPAWLDEEYGCAGTQSCEECAVDESCGLPSAGCGAVDFSHPRIQLALEFCNGAVGPVRVTGVVQRVTIQSIGCLSAGDRT